MLTLTGAEMAVLVGGLRGLDANEGQSANGVLSANPGTLNNDFFVNLLDMSTKWSKSAAGEGQGVRGRCSSVRSLSTGGRSFWGFTR